MYKNLRIIFSVSLQLLLASLSGKAVL